MRCIQVVNVRWFNATAWYGMYLSRLLREGGHEVLVLGLPGTLSARKGEEWGLPMQLLDLNTATPWGIAALYGKLKRLVAEFKPDVVNCHRGESYLLWGLLKKELGSFRLVRTRGDQRLPKANLVNRWLHNEVSDAVITTNSPMTRHFQNVFHVPADKLHQILGGVDTQTFRPDPAARARTNYLRLLHADGTMTIYVHLRTGSARVQIGQSVAAGELIAESGNTGYSTGPHLHFAVQRNDGKRLISIPFVLKGQAPHQGDWLSN